MFLNIKKNIIFTEKVKLIVDYQIYPQKKNDEIYLYISNKDLKYSYDIGNAHVTTEKIIIGNNDISKYS